MTAQQKPIEGLKLICHNARGVNEPDDTSFPYKLEVSLRPPEFMIIAFFGLYGGSEELVVRGMTKEGLEQCIEENGFKTHPRLRTLRVTGPEGEVILSITK